MITIADIERKRDRLAAIIDPIGSRSAERSEHSIWPEEAKAIAAAIGATLPTGWGDVSEQLARISDAAKMSQKRGAVQKTFVDRLREGLARLDHAISIRRNYATAIMRTASIPRDELLSEPLVFPEEFARKLDGAEPVQTDTAGGEPQ